LPEESAQTNENGKIKKINKLAKENDQQREHRNN